MKELLHVALLLLPLELERRAPDGRWRQLMANRAAGGVVGLPKGPLLIGVQGRDEFLPHPRPRAQNLAKRR